MNDLKTTIKRIYTRFIVLTAVVVFGAIAIAQAQKEQATSDGFEEQPEVSAAFASARPIPIQNNQTIADPNVRPASATDLMSDVGETSNDAWAVSDERVAAAEYQEDLAPVSHDEFGYEDLPPARESLPPTGETRRANPIRSQSTDDMLPPLDEAPMLLDDSASDLPPLQDLPEFEARSAAPSQAAAALDDYGSFAEDDAIPQDNQDYREEAYDAPVYQAEPLDSLPVQQEAPLEESYQPQTIAPRQPAAVDSYVPDALTPTATPQQQPTFDQTNSRNGQAPRGFDRRDQIEDNVVPRMAMAGRSDIAALGKPGPQTMEGLQTPTLTIQKTAPTEVQVGQPAKFEIRVRNVGRVPADNVIIKDLVPAGTKFIEATPKATQAADGTIFWETGSLPPGQEVSVSMQLMPITEGLVGSVATVVFETSASARTRSTKPDLVLEHTGPLKVLKGEPVRFSIKLSNPGSGAATHVVLEEDVPVGLSHSSGAKLEYEVGTIQPGQTRHLELTLKAAEAGHVINNLTARADGGLAVEDVTELDVVAPKLQVAIDGPKTRYLERQATFTVTVANPGTALASNVELLAVLPKGLKFVSTNNSGYFDQARNAVIWSLEQLPAGEMGRAQFTAMPVELGAYQINAEGRADMELQASQEHPIAIEGIAALHYTMEDKVDPIEVGGQTTYEIKVTNQGSKDATNVQFRAQIPEGMRPLNAQGPTAEDIAGQIVVFAPIDRLPPKGQASFRIIVQAQKPGDHRVRVEMRSDEIQAVIKEESTRIYQD